MKTYLVGGAVRDELLGLPVRERDYVVVGARPEELTQQGYIPVGKDFPVFLHPTTKAEYALARTERKTGRGYQGFHCYAAPDVTLTEDLRRRDLTINAMARSADGELIDPYGGQQDLEQRLLRHVSPAFVEDPLRVLRVARFAARFAHLGFRVAPETAALMRQIAASDELSTLASERLWQETAKALQTQSPATYFSVLHQCQALSTLLAQRLPQHLDWPALHAWSVTSAGPAPTNLQTVSELASPWALASADLASQAGSQAAQHWQTVFNAPNQGRDYSRLLIQVQTFLQQPEPNAWQGFDLLQEMDSWRRPERAREILQLAALLPTADYALEQLVKAFETARKVSVQPVLKAGYQGAEIGTELNRRRTEAARKAWSSTGG